MLGYFGQKKAEIFINVAYTNSHYNVQTQFLVYNYGNLISDFGGFLGLLLGQGGRDPPIFKRHSYILEEYICTLW
jgi:hypothetical protein